MEKLKLPIIRDIPEKPRWLSMDDYVEFVNFNRENFRKGKMARTDTMAIHATVPFALK